MNFAPESGAARDTCDTESGGPCVCVVASLSMLSAAAARDVARRLSAVPVACGSGSRVGGFVLRVVPASAFTAPAGGPSSVDRRAYSIHSMWRSTCAMWAGERIMAFTSELTATMEGLLYHPVRTSARESSTWRSEQARSDTPTLALGSLAYATVRQPSHSGSHGAHSVAVSSSPPSSTSHGDQYKTTLRPTMGRCVRRQPGAFACR